VIVTAVTAQLFATNCYVVAAGPGHECLVVDPGVGIGPALAEVLRREGLRPVAVLLTHGHLDHVFGVTEVPGVAEAPGVAEVPGVAELPGGPEVFVHEADRSRLADPWAGFDPWLRQLLAQQSGLSTSWTEPPRTLSLRDGEVVARAGLRVEVHHAPGHTEGSALFRVSGVPDREPVGVDDLAGLSATVFSGDVLFAGSVGRTDLPGGDGAAMRRSLQDVVLALPDPTLVLPGHGPATTVARERATNPYLVDLAVG